MPGGQVAVAPPRAVRETADRWPGASGTDGDLVPFGIELTNSGDRQVVRLVGELDLAYAGPVRAALVGIAGPEVVVDLSDLTFIDASGLSALVAARGQMATEGHRLLLVGAGSAVRRVFELTGLADLLTE